MLSSEDAYEWALCEIMLIAFSLNYFKVEVVSLVVCEAALLIEVWVALIIELADYTNEGLDALYARFFLRYSYLMWFSS